MKIGIVGFGKLARDYYLPALRRLREVQVTAVADPLPASGAAARSLLPTVRVYEHAERLLDEESLDAVLVSSPPASHLRIWKACRKLGVPVFMEKPLVLPGQLGQEEVPRGPLMMNFNRRFWPPYLRMVRDLRRGRIGEPQWARFSLLVNLGRWAPVTAYRLAESEGGVLCDLGSHVFDQIYHFFREELQVVRAVQDGRNRVHLELLLASGLQVSAEVGYATRGRERTWIQGSLGALLVPDPNTRVHLAREVWWVRKLVQGIPDALLYTFRGVCRRYSMMRYSVFSALRHFLSCVRSGKVFSPGLEEGIRNARWLAAASRSLTEGVPVSLNDPVPVRCWGFQP